MDWIFSTKNLIFFLFLILALNETRLDSSISDDLVSVDGYDLIRADRNRNGGGVCIYARCNINYLKRPDLVPNSFEAVSLERLNKQIVSHLSFQLFTDHQIQWRSQPDFLLLLCKFQLLAIIISYHFFRN